MTMHILPKADLPRLLGVIAARYELFGPVVEPVSGQTLFDRAAAPADIRLDAPIPVNTPKFAVFPHFERILSYRYDRESKRLDIIREDLQPWNGIGPRFVTQDDVAVGLVPVRFLRSRRHVDHSLPYRTTFIG